VRVRRRAFFGLAALAVAAFLAVAPAGADPTTATIVVTSTFAGLDDVASGEFEPPDVQVAAGAGWVVEMANVAERVWRTGGGAAPQVVLTQPLATLYHTGRDEDLTDPRVEYDAPTGRFFATVSDVAASSVLLAVSQSSDPTGAWSVYAFRASGCPDQPRLGISDGVVVLGADIFSSCDTNPAPFVGAELWIVNKSQALAGAPTVSSTTYGPDGSLSTLTPVQSLSPTPTEYVVGVDDPNSSIVHLLSVTGAPPAAVRVQVVATIGITPLQQPPGAAQPPSASGRLLQIATNDDRILDSVWENGKLWFSANTGCVPAGDSTLRACGRIAELSTTTRSLDWDTNIGVAGAHVFFPALRPDSSGNLAVVYGESSPTINPQLDAVGRAPNGTFSAPVVIAQSSGPYLGDRYGDYFGAARDPSDPTTVWVAGEIASGSQGWGTALASLRVTATPVAPVVIDRPPPRLRALVSSGRSGRIVKLGLLALDDGANISERVTVANARNAVVFRSSTALAAVRAGKTYAVSWRTRKTQVGTFRFCVRTVSAAGLQSVQSCAAVAVRR
jgi:hypothetical protein